MFAVAYYVTTSTCLFGANALKRKACISSPTNSSNSNDTTNSTNNSAKKSIKLSIATSQDQLTANKNTVILKAHKKQAPGNKRGNDSRKATNSSGGSASSNTAVTYVVPASELAKLKTR